VLNNNFWLGRTALITGHTGFKGGWLSLWLQSLGAKVVGYSLEPPTTPSLFEAASVADGMDSILGDVRDYDHLREVIEKHDPSIIFHMAAQPLVRYSYENAIETYSTNVMGTVNLLEAVRHSNSVEAVVNVTSDKCYENKEWVWGYREDEAMGGYDPYSSSKGCAELVTSAYRSSYFSSDGVSSNQSTFIATARAGNVIGGGDWAEDRLIPDVITSFIKGRPVVIRSPNSIRPWQHVLEPLYGYIQLAEKLSNDGEKFARGWNFGPHDDDTATVGSVVERLASIWGGGTTWEMDGNNNPHEARYLKLDCSQARTHIQWRPCWRLDEGLTNTVEWFRAYKSGVDMRDFTLNQIKKYQCAAIQN